MRRRAFIRDASALASAALTGWPLGARPVETRALRDTTVAIDGEQFLINGSPTYAGRIWRDMRIEGLLLNARLVQGIFDDLNPETRSRWAYPDTGEWDAERNTREFVAAMPAWRRHGLLAFTVNLQGGSPEGYSREQPWYNSAFREDGSLRREYFDRLARILDRADELGMVAILGYFYFGQDQRLRNETAVVRATRHATEWLLDRGYTNVVIELANECDLRQYDHAILRSPRIVELLDLAKGMRRADRRLLVGASFSGGVIPASEVVAASDFVLLHGNGVSDPARIAQMVDETRALGGYRPMPILFNEDDHFDFDRPVNNMTAAIGRHASWGFFDPGANNYRDGYQCPPVNWGLNTSRKRAFFELLQEITGGK